MAGISKEEREKRSKIGSYFKRDSLIYTNFEELTKKKSKQFIIYDFLNECAFRDVCNMIGGICCTYNESDSFDFDEFEIMFQDLHNIDESIHNYFSSLLAHSKILKNQNKKKYSIENMIDEALLIKVLGEERVKSFDNQGYSHNLEYLIKRILTKEEIEKLRKHIDKKPFGTSTIIKQDYKNPNDITRYFGGTKNNTLLVELDLTKDPQELKEYIDILHKDYKNNEIKNIYDLLSLSQPKTTEHEIFTTNGHKDFQKLLADKLFIYDCRKVGLSYSQINAELNNYHSEYSDKYNKSREYYSSISSFIDKKEYSSFNKGYL